MFTFFLVFIVAFVLGLFVGVNLCDWLDRSDRDLRERGGIPSRLKDL